VQRAGTQKAIAIFDVRRTAVRITAYKRAFTHDLRGIFLLRSGGRRSFLDTARRRLAEVSFRGHVLDIGTGPGLLPIQICLASPRATVVGVDVEPLLLDDARKHAEKMGVGHRATFLQADAMKLPFLDGTFDMVASTMSFQMWPDQERGLREMYRVLKPGGVAYILVDREYVYPGKHGFLDRFYRRSVKSMRNRLERAGFASVRAGYQSTCVEVCGFKQDEESNIVQLGIAAGE